MNSKAEVPIHCAQTPFTGRIADTIQEKHSTPPVKGNKSTRQAEVPIYRAQTPFTGRIADQYPSKRKMWLDNPFLQDFFNRQGCFALRRNQGDTLPINGARAR